MKKIFKSEKRETIKNKLKIKEQKGGTLAGQLARLKVTKNYAGAVKKFGSRIK